jgi:hypothetical protein
MEDAIRRAVDQQFPELSGGYHLPRFGRARERGRIYFPD